MQCLNHPDVQARWQCVVCKRTFCPNCIKTVGGYAAQAAVCPVCGEKCVDIIQIEEAVIVEKRSLWQELPSAFTYPLQKEGPYILIAGAIFFAIAEFLATHAMFAGIIFSVLIAGYLCRYFFSVLFKSAMGKPSPPTWPDFDPATLFGESFRAIAKFLGPAIISLAPAALYLYFSRLSFDILFVLLVVLGCLYYPVGLAAAVIADVTGLNPVPIMRSVLRVPLDYLVTSVVFMVLFFLNYLRETYLLVHVFAVGSLIRWLLLLYFWMMAMRLLGMFYYTNRRKLQWM